MIEKDYSALGEKAVTWTKNLSPKLDHKAFMRFIDNVEMKRGLLLEIF